MTISDEQVADEAWVENIRSHDLLNLTKRIKSDTIVGMSEKKKPRKVTKHKEIALLQVPYKPLLGISLPEPILPKATMDAALEAIAPFTAKVRWEKWGMAKLRPSCGSILLEGASGTGKTTLARWLAKKVSKAIIEITMADVGSSDPGDTERNIRHVFEVGEQNDNCCIFIDECDGMLWSRDKAGPDSMWFLAVVNEWLMQIERYKGLIILATNMPHFLDPALERRIIAHIKVPKPDFQVRMELWMDKMPNEYPLTLDEKALKELAKFRLTGAQIETAILREAQVAIREQRHPKLKSLCNIASEYDNP